MSYDDLDDTGGNSTFLLGFIAGTVLGAGLGLLFAPRPGVETRRDVSQRAQELGKRASHEYDTAAERFSKLAEQGKDAYQSAASRAGDLVDRAADGVDDAADLAKDAVDEARAGAKSGAASAKAGLRDVEQRS